MFGLVNISVDWDWLVLVWIGYYSSGLVNIGLDGLNIKSISYQLILARIG